MTEPTKPPYDVDALARRLPRRAPSPERSLAIRRALLRAAEPPSRPSRRGPSWGWLLGAGAPVAVAVCLVIAWRARPPTAAQPARPATVAAATPAAATPAAATPDAATPVEELRDGVQSLDIQRPVQLTRGDATITAPAGARFDVDVRDGHVHLVTVKAGWVVIASAHAAATMLQERQTWTLTPGAPAPPPTASATVPDRPATPSAPPAAPTGGAPTGAAAATRSNATRPRPRPPTAIAVDAPAPDEAPAVDPPPPASPPGPTTDQDFRDGLRALLGGDAHKAVVALDRACTLPSTSQADICYWAAVAWLRTDDRVHARRAFSDVVARWPGATHIGEANVALGWLLLELGDRTAARTRFAAAANDGLPSVRADALRGLDASR